MIRDVNHIYKQFLFVEWNSERIKGGGGLLHVMTHLQRIIQLCLNENKGRCIILSNIWRLDFCRHQLSEYKKDHIDIREYLNFPRFITDGEKLPVEIIFDDSNFITTQFSTNKQIGIFSKKHGAGISLIRRNNKNIKEFNQKHIQKITDFEFAFFCGWFVDPNISIKNNSFYNIKFNSELILLSNEIYELITDNNTLRDFYVIHLRRGDRMCFPAFANSSEITFVCNTIEEFIPKNSLIYIMTNDTSEYSTSIKSKCKNHSIFVKQNFDQLCKLEVEDNFKLFVVEENLKTKACKIFTNRVKNHSPLCFSLQKHYKTLVRNNLKVSANSSVY